MANLKGIGCRQIGEQRKPVGRPTNMPNYAEICLRALAAQGLGTAISIGGALGLLHYLDYRPTRDVHAWWTPETTPQERQRVVQVIEETLKPFGQVRKRTWGDVVSIELFQEGKAVFSFQIAALSAQLEPSVPAPWVDVLLDSFSDLIANKMVALVERGAPRDFRDIYTLCQSGLTTPKECWELWRRRQQLSGGDLDSFRARLAVETHLARIAQHRPLEEISDPQKRAEAEEVRRWFAQEFLNALSE
jgi:hypothetical protein